MCSHKVQLASADQIAGVPARPIDVNKVTWQLPIPIYQYHFQECMTEIVNSPCHVCCHISTSQHLVTKIDFSREGHGLDSASRSCKLLNICANPKCHVMFSKTKMNVNWHLHFQLKCHLNVICLVVRVISICKVLINMWFFSSQVTLHVKK
jgi:hypothetical protein